MKILCAYSGVEFSCEHFPASLYSRETCHPIFNIPQKKLISYIGKWASQTALTPTDSYLLFLAVLKSSDLVEFRVPVIRTARTDSLVAQNMEALFKAVLKLNTVSIPASIFPSYAITVDTRTLDNVQYWIENWEEAYSDFHSGKHKDYDNRKLAQREAALVRLIKNPHRPVSTFAGPLGDWAAIAGSFPMGMIPSPFSGLPVTLSDYWKELIKRCATETGLFSVPRTDLEDLLEHCETNIPFGSIHSLALFKVLRHALERQKNFLGLGDLDISRSSYTLLSQVDSIETANMQVVIDSAPDHLPQPEEYPTKFAFMKAKLRWDMAQKNKGSV